MRARSWLDCQLPPATCCPSASDSSATLGRPCSERRGGTARPSTVMPLPTRTSGWDSSMNPVGPIGVRTSPHVFGALRTLHNDGARGI